MAQTLLTADIGLDHKCRDQVQMVPRLEVKLKDVKLLTVGYLVRGMLPVSCHAMVEAAITGYIKYQNFPYGKACTPSSLRAKKGLLASLL